MKNLSLKIKLMGNAGILLMLLIISSVYAIYSMNQIGHELADVAEHRYPAHGKARHHYHSPIGTSYPI